LLEYRIAAWLSIEIARDVPRRAAITVALKTFAVVPLEQY